MFLTALAGGTVVCTEGTNSNQTVNNVNTIADGTAVKTPGEKIFPYIKENIDEIITVEDSELIVAFLCMLHLSQTLTHVEYMRTP